MKLVRRFVVCGLLFVAAVWSSGQESGAVAPAEAGGATEQTKLATEAAAAVASGAADPATPDFLEHMVDVVLALFDVKSSGNTPTHYGIAALLLVGSFLLRRVVTTILFGILRRFSAKTETTLDDKLFGALEAPVATLITVAGAVMALKVLKLSDTGDRTLVYASTVAFSLAIFWLLLRAFNALLDHAQEVAVKKQLGIAAFMPWIKKSLVVVFVIFGVLMIAQSLGADVKAFLAGLGIGGLAFALAAQDTIANIFGSVVVAIDQPFKLGEVVKIGAEIGTVEDIGLRSTKIRKLDRSLMVIPNKSVAGENITNLSRFNGRRVEQVLGVTYSTKAEQMEGLVEEIRTMLMSEPEIDPTSVIVYFRDFSASSMDLWLVYVVKDPDFHKHMALRQRLNLAYMRAIEARGLAFAFPTQSIHFDGEVAKQLATKWAQA